MLRPHCARRILSTSRLYLSKESSSSRFHHVRTSCDLPATAPHQYSLVSPPSRWEACRPFLRSLTTAMSSTENESESRKRKVADDAASESPATDTPPTADQPRKKGKAKLSNAQARLLHTRGGSAKADRDVHAGSYANEGMRKLLGIELPPEEDPAVTATRKKKKVAFLLGYVGTNYAGFQINNDQRTLQGDFELALLRCHLMLRSNFGHPFKYGWSTSGRTDKGVHACAQVTSAKIELLPGQTLEDVQEELNRVLPDDFRVLDINRVTRGFCAHTQRDRVRYQYFIPSFLFCDVAEVRSIFETMGAHDNGRLFSDPLSQEEITKAASQFKDFRITDTQLELLRKALHCFEGTHSFHNFTKGVKVTEARATRYMEYFRVEDPVVFDDGSEWIPTQVLGQSFLLNQIRKMICMAIGVTRDGAPPTDVSDALSKKSDVRISTAPAQGLYLDMSFYTNYNKKKNQSNSDLPDLDWTNEESDAFKRWKEFRNGVVMKHVAAEEVREGNFCKYLFLQEYGFDYRQNSQAKGDGEDKSDVGDS
jgi:tRNA pseudouridine38-40 synthase